VQTNDEGPVAVFFAGCLIDKVMPEVGDACLKVLRRAGVNVCLIDREACCGIPALSAGDSGTFEALVGENLSRIFKGRCDVVLTACATCTMTLRDLWPEMTTHPGNREKARDLSKRVMDIGEYVLSSTALGRDPRFFKQDEGKMHGVTWHDPCHLKGATKTGTLARQFLKGLPGYTFSEMHDAGVCCGSGGSFSLAHQDLSSAIGHRKVQRIGESGAEMVTTACPACVIQIRDMLARKGSNVRVRHFMEIVADALDDSGLE
jgi:glycolate oxidase iron-sulfur subunit